MTLLFNSVFLTKTALSWVLLQDGLHKLVSEKSILRTVRSIGSVQIYMFDPKLAIYTI